MSKRRSDSVREIICVKLAVDRVDIWVLKRIVGDIEMRVELFFESDRILLCWDVLWDFIF